MFDPNYDPYEELQIARHNIGELIKAVNHQLELVKNINQQNQTLNARIRHLERRIHCLETQNINNLAK